MSLMIGLAMVAGLFVAVAIGMASAQRRAIQRVGGNPNLSGFVARD